MTPADLAAKLRHIERARAGANTVLVRLAQQEAELVIDHADEFPFTFAGSTYEAWHDRNGRAYCRITKTEKPE